MTYIRRLILALALSAGLAPAFAQVPPPVPALPDTERRTTYSISASTCACNVNFALYGDSTDYANWIEVFVNGVRMSQAGNWTLSSVTGTIGSIPLPITNAVLTFTAPQTGTIQIVGARRPRRTSQFNEGAGVPTRNFNVVLSDLTAQNRELWDKTNDVTGRALMSQPGVTLSLLPLPAACASGVLGFDATGLIPQCRVGAGSGNMTGPGAATLGNAAVFGATPNLLTDAGGAPALTNNNLSDLTNKPTARTNLGVAIGTNVEAWDADLDCLAALGTTGIVRRTGAGTCSAATLVTLAEGGTNAALTADLGGIVYSTASALAILPHASSIGFPLLSGAGGAPTWASAPFLSQPQGRLTLSVATPALPITTADIAAATAVTYAFDGNGGAVPINGVMSSFTQLSLTLNTGAQLSGLNYDYFIGSDAGTIRLCTGPAWTAGAGAGSAVARGTGAGSTDIQQTGGIWVNTNTMTCSYSATSFSCAVSACTYVGTGRMTANGQTEDSFAKRFLWNAYNQVLRPMRVIDATASWAYGTATTRQANANTANQLAFVTGLVGSMATAKIEITVQNSTATARSVNFGIGLDVTNAYTQVTAIASCTNAGFTNNFSEYSGFPGLGFHFLSWNETGAGTDTQTWFGTPFSHLVGAVSG